MLHFRFHPVLTSSTCSAQDLSAPYPQASLHGSCSSHWTSYPCEVFLCAHHRYTPHLYMLHSCVLKGFHLSIIWTPFLLTSARCSPATSRCFPHILVLALMPKSASPVQKCFWTTSLPILGPGIQGDVWTQSWVYMLHPTTHTHTKHWVLQSSNQTIY